MKLYVFITCCVLPLVRTLAHRDGTELLDSMTSFKDVTSLDVNNEEQDFERLVAETDLELNDKASTLKCFNCASTESWQHCEKNQILVECPQASTRCIKSSISLKKPRGPIITEYFKSCVTVEKCDTQHFPACLAGSKESARCTIDCCDKTFCNKEVYQSRQVSKDIKDDSQKDDGEDKLKYNKRTFFWNCKRPCLIYATNTQINGIELKTSRKVQGWTASLKEVMAIDVDVETQTLYWSDIGEHTIKRASLLSNLEEVVIGGEHGDYDGIAVDWVARLLYWTDLTHKRIDVSKLDGSSRKTIIDKNLDRPRAIVLDPKQGLLFFTDWGKAPRLERSNLAGQDRRILISTGIKWPNGLVIDYSTKKLYICDSRLDRIESINYDGSERHILYKVPNIHPFDLALYKTTVFWGDWYTKTIEKVNVSTGKRLQGFGRVSKDKVKGLAVLDESRQPKVTSRCSFHNGGCSHICFTTGIKSYVCGCPNGVALLADQRTCDLGSTTKATLVTTAAGPATRQTTAQLPTATELLTTELPTAEVTTAKTTSMKRTTMQPETTERTIKEQPTTPTKTTSLDRSTLMTTEIQTTCLTQLVTTEEPTTAAKESTSVLPTTHQHTVTSQPSTRIRLADGDSPREGRVEIRHNGKWGTICDDYWDLQDAMVICRMLGFPDAVAAFGNAYYGPGRGRIWLDDVHCMGHESDISQCRHPGWGFANCRHSEDAGVKCRHVNTPRPALPVRLMDGRYPREGRVEVFHAGQWGTICDDLWDKADADVICRMLGYPEAIAATRRATFGQGYGKIWMDNVQCKGNERSIEDCSRLNWGSHNCRHSEDAGVICRPLQRRTTLPPISTTTFTASPVEGFAIFCLPHSMHIRITRKQLVRMTSRKLRPGLLHLNDPSCGASKVSDTHVTFSTALDGCGTKRRQDGDTLTFTNKVYGQLLPKYFKRVFRPPPVTFPFKCSYSKITPRDRIYTPPHAHAYGYIEQW